MATPSGVVFFYHEKSDYIFYKSSHTRADEDETLEGFF